MMTQTRDKGRRLIGRQKAVVWSLGEKCVLAWMFHSPKLETPADTGVSEQA
ncbi:Uncharacterized protein YR821_1277 [Yersinia ruckeri]|uniref:Uncharacterized protein n=1 Tax=Yersinia ruckeri TaxID=29486 RepID=A0A0A8VHM3_YERRU|nr:Uncharacterized protein YR821_1277 [Yersinia ruckeri]CEK27106.1 hypothetical protein CSF007_6745 [Yersinia ruckeri]